MYTVRYMFHTSPEVESSFIDGKLNLIGVYITLGGEKGPSRKENWRTGKVRKRKRTETEKNSVCWERTQEGHN